MARRTTYHPGGFDAAKPAQNRSEEWTPSGYTRWDVAGAQVETRTLTSAESDDLAADDAALSRDANATSLRDKAAQAIAANNNYLAITNPTNAQVVAQVNRMTRVDNALIRLAIGALDSTSGT